MLLLNKVILVCCLALRATHGLENGLARTPPMGWMSWERFECITDCKAYPDDCISDQLIRRTADAMVSGGYLKVGYEYIIIDDCWLSHKRDAEGRLQPDPQRFPHGIKNVSDYVHSKGLKFGIYEDIGTHTCAGYPGLQGNFEIDTKTLAEWEVDYIKVDGCYSTDDQAMIDQYVEFGKFLNKTGRPIVYSCSWPAYMGIKRSNYSLLQNTCNLWRNYADISDSWNDVKGIIGWFAKNQNQIVPHAGPGHWNDPDMLVIGNYGLTRGQSEAQMVLWAILAAPLLMSTDLNSIQPEMKHILLNKDVIAINQDELGIPGLFRTNASKYIDVWTRKITPVLDGLHSYAIAYLFKNSGTYPNLLKATLAGIGINSTNSYLMCNVLKPKEKAKLVEAAHTFTVRTNPGSVQLYKAVPVTSKILKCKKRLTCSNLNKKYLEKHC